MGSIPKFIRILFVLFLIGNSACLFPRLRGGGGGSMGDDYDSGSEADTETPPETAPPTHDGVEPPSGKRPSARAPRSTVPPPISPGVDPVPGNPTPETTPDEEFKKETDELMRDPQLPEAASPPIVADTEDPEIGPFAPSPTEGTESAQNPPVLKVAPEAPQDRVESPANDLFCKPVGNGFKPVSRKIGRALGRDPIPRRSDCERAVAAARNGVVCSFTGVNPGTHAVNWKVTNINGITNQNREFGWWGSSTTLNNCLQATLNSAEKEVCVHSAAQGGGNSWFVTDIAGKRSITQSGRTYSSVQKCLEDPRIKRGRTANAPPAVIPANPSNLSAQRPNATNPQSPRNLLPQNRPVSPNGLNQSTHAQNGGLPPEIIPVDPSSTVPIPPGAARPSQTNFVPQTPPPPAAPRPRIAPFSRLRSLLTPRVSRGIKHDSHEAWRRDEVKNDHTFFGKHCAQCHHQTSGVPLPRWTGDLNQWRSRFSTASPTERSKLADMAGKLYDKVVDEQSMPPAPRDHAFRQDPEAQRFVAFLKQFHDANRPQNPGAPNDNTPAPSGHSNIDAEIAPAIPNRQSASVPPVPRGRIPQLLPPNKIAYYRAMLPQVQSEVVQAALMDPATIFWDRDRLPHGYQDPTAPVMGLRTLPQLDARTLKVVIDRRTGRPSTKLTGFVNGAPFVDTRTGRLKVWGTGVGLEESDAKSFSFINLPRDKAGNLQPVRHWKERRPGDALAVDKWEYPIGTIIGEVVYDTNARGKPQVKEIRIRIKDRPSPEPWAPDIFKPYVTAQSLKDELAGIANEKPELRAEASRIHQHLQNPNRLYAVSLGSINPKGYNKGNIDAKGATEVLPNMSEQLVNELFARKKVWSPSVGAVWDRNDKLVSFGPTTKQKNGLVPQNTKMGAVSVDRQSCNKCHGVTNTPIKSFFNPHHPDMRGKIDAYGNTPGNDGVIGLHFYNPKLLPSFSMADSAGRTRDNRQLMTDFWGPILQKTSGPSKPQF